MCFNIPSNILIEKLQYFNLVENKKDAEELAIRLNNSTLTEEDKQTICSVVDLIKEKIDSNKKKMETNNLIEKLYDLEHTDNHKEVLDAVKRLIVLDSLFRVYPKLIIRHAEAFCLYLNHASSRKLTNNFNLLLDIIPVCIERGYVIQYKAIVKKLKELGWTKIKLMPRDKN